MAASLDRARGGFASAGMYASQHLAVGHLGIGKTDLVVDVGSGQGPHPRANILCDKFIDDNTERASHAGLRIDRPLVVSDATQTPFADKSFDFAFCAHLLEHMEDPAALLGELERIGRAGYIETPSKIYEKVHGWDFHRWFVSIEGDRLVLEAKDRPIYDGDLHAWFRRRLEAPPFWRAFIPHLVENELLTVFVWNGSIAYRVDGAATPTATEEGFQRAQLEGHGAAAEASHGPTPPAEEPTGPQTVKGWVDSVRRRRSNAYAARVLDDLRCIICGGNCDRGVDEVVCADCGRRYPRRGDLYFFLLD